MEKESDVQLIQRILSGDEAAFDLLVQRHKKSVHALAWRKIGDFHDAEEITQDTFLQVYKRLPTLKDPYKFAGWLYVIANRLCIDRMRQKNLTIQSLEDTPVEEVEKSSYTHHVSEQRQTEIAERRRAIVKKLLEKLPESERTVMTLFYLGEMTVKEISKFLGVSASAIHNRLYRARKRLQEEEELLVQEVLIGVQIPTSVSQNIMQRVTDITPLPQTSPKPVIPWIAFGTAFLLLALLLGTSNQYLTRFQKPYSFEATSEPTIAIIEAPVVLETDAKPALRNQAGRATALDKRTGTGLQGSETVSTTGLSGHPENVEAWMPDENLRRAIKSELKLGDIPLEIAHLQNLEQLTSIDDGIENIVGLEHAVNLRLLHLAPNEISDLTPLANLHNLRTLKLYENRLVDVSPLAGLVGLETLHLQNNQIVDISSLAGLVNLKDLQLDGNRIEYFSSLAGLTNLQVLRINNNVGVDISSVPTSNLTEFLYDHTCNIPGLPNRDRITDREYPSVFAGWHNIINLPTLSWDERLVYHDLYFSHPMFGLHWHWTPTGMKISGDSQAAKQQRDKMLKENPNMIFLVAIFHYGANPSLFPYPDDWEYWLRDESGNRIHDKGWTELLIDYTLPGAQDIFVQQVVEVAKCGIYDGIYLNWWQDDKALEPFYQGDTVDAKVSMLQKIREVIREDFLIIVNGLRSKIPHSAPYVNGTLMGTRPYHPQGYTHRELQEIESTLLWSEENFRYPQINSLKGSGIETEPLDSPKNRQWMRVFTTLSLTHSDGYVNYVTGISSLTHTHQYPIWEGHSGEHARGEPHDHTNQHYWYDFWNAELGRPIGKKGKLYRSREGLFIREFTNGWAVYNRSGKTQKIQLIESATGVASGITGTSHTLSDLDGEIFVK